MRLVIEPSIYNKSVRDLIKLFTHVYSNQSASTFATLKILDLCQYICGSEKIYTDHTNIDRSLMLIQQIRDFDNRNSQSMDRKSRENLFDFRNLTEAKTFEMAYANLPYVLFNPCFPIISQLRVNPEDTSQRDQAYINSVYIVDASTGNLTFCANGQILRYNLPEVGPDKHEYCEIQIDDEWFIFDGHNKKIIKLENVKIQECEPTFFAANGVALKRVKINNTWKLLDLKSGKLIMPSWPGNTEFGTPFVDNNGNLFVKYHGKRSIIASVLNITTGKSVRYNGDKIKSVSYKGEKFKSFGNIVKHPITGDLYILSLNPVNSLYNLSKGKVEKLIPNKFSFTRLKNLSVTKNGQFWAELFGHSAVLNLQDMSLLHSHYDSNPAPTAFLYSSDGYLTYVVVHDGFEYKIDLNSLQKTPLCQLNSDNIDNLSHLISSFGYTTLAYYNDLVSFENDFLIERYISLNSECKYLILYKRDENQSSRRYRNFYFYDLLGHKFIAPPEGFKFDPNIFSEAGGDHYCFVDKLDGGRRIYNLSKQEFLEGIDSSIVPQGYPYFDPYNAETGYFSGELKGKPGYFNIQTAKFMPLEDPRAANCSDKIFFSSSGRAYAIVNNYGISQKFSVVDVENSNVIYYQEVSSEFMHHEIELAFAPNGDGFVVTNYTPANRGLICFTSELFNKQT